MATSLVALIGCGGDASRKAPPAGVAPTDHSSFVRDSQEGRTPKASLMLDSIVSYANLKPETLRDWLLASDSMSAQRTTSMNLTIDAPTTWLVYGDTVGVWFDRGEQQIVILDLRTRAHRRIGRRGSGPLEFSGLTTLARWSGDSILAMDGGQRRASVIAFAKNGSGRTFPNPTVDSLDPAQLIGGLASGALVFRSYHAFTQRGDPGYFRPSGKILVTTANDGHAESVPIIGPASIRATVGETHSLTSAPIGLAPLIAIGKNQIAWLPGGSDTLHLWSGGNGGVRTVVLELAPLKLTKAIQERIKNKYLSRYAGSGAGLQEAISKYISLPDQLSPLTGLFASPDSTLWLRLQSGIDVDVGSTWIQIDPSTRVRRCVYALPSARIVGFGTSVAIVAHLVEETDEYQISVSTLPTSCRFSGRLAGSK